MDRHIHGSTERISPEAPVPVVRVQAERETLGGAANVAVGLRALGADCRLVGVVGADAAAEALCGRLEEEGIGSESLLRISERPTTVKTRVLSRHQQMIRIDRESDEDLSEAASLKLQRCAVDAMDGADVLVLEDYDKGALGRDTGAVLLSEAARRGIPSVVDPKLRRFLLLQGALLFKCNGRELAAALGRESVWTLLDDLRPVLRRLACRNLLITLGQRGMLLLEGGEGRELRIPSRARDVYDVSGAGDTVTAVVSAFIGADAPLREAAVLANFAAGIEVSKSGAQPVSCAELVEEWVKRGPACGVSSARRSAVEPGRGSGAEGKRRGAAPPSAPDTDGVEQAGGGR